MVIERTSPPKTGAGKPELYSDVSINLDRTPMSGQVARVLNEDAVKRSIKSLLLTAVYERKFSRVGSRLRSLLFEPMDDVTRDRLIREVRETITNHEPRAQLVGVSARGNEGTGAYYVSIVFTTVNTGSPVQLDVVLKRVR